MPDDLLAEATEYFARCDDEFYRAVVYSGYRHAAEKQAQVMSSFARTAIASAVKAERERIADELDEQILSSASTSPHLDLAYYVHQLRGENNGQ